MIFSRLRFLNQLLDIFSHFKKKKECFLPTLLVLLFAFSLYTWLFHFNFRKKSKNGLMLPRWLLSSSISTHKFHLKMYNLFILDWDNFYRKISDETAFRHRQWNVQSYYPILLQSKKLRDKYLPRDISSVAVKKSLFSLTWSPYKTITWANSNPQ